MLLQKLSSFINLFPDHSFYQKVNICQKLSYRQEPPFECAELKLRSQDSKMIQKLNSLINLFPEHSFYEKLIFSSSIVDECRIQVLLTSLLNASPEISFIYQFTPRTLLRWECKFLSKMELPPLRMRDSNFAHKALKCFSVYVLPLSIYSVITSSVRK